MDMEDEAAYLSYYDLSSLQHGRVYPVYHSSYNLNHLVSQNVSAVSVIFARISTCYKWIEMYTLHGVLPLTSYPIRHPYFPDKLAHASVLLQDAVFVQSVAGETWHILVLC